MNNLNLENRLTGSSKGQYAEGSGRIDSKGETQLTPTALRFGHTPLLAKYLIYIF